MALFTLSVIRARGPMSDMELLAESAWRLHAHKDPEGVAEGFVRLLNDVASSRMEKHKWIAVFVRAAIRIDPELSSERLFAAAEAQWALGGDTDPQEAAQSAIKPNGEMLVP